MKLGWAIGLGMLFAVSGCYVSTGCEVSDGDGLCSFGEDAGSGMDASSDAGSTTDSGTGDGSLQDGAADAAFVPDGGIDAGPPTLSVDQFCEAQYRTAKQWRDKLEECCFANQDERATLLFNSFFYRVSSDGKDSVELCMEGLKGSAANLTFVGTAAIGCAAKFNAQFPPADATCPPQGFPNETLESMIGHGAASLVQIPECRTAIVGKTAFNQACGNSFECTPGLRCLGTEGSKTCRDPLGRGNPCNVTSECADGFVCMGLASGTAGRVCYPATELLELGSACDGRPESATGGTTECRVGLICVDNKCSAPLSTAICGP